MLSWIVLLAVTKHSCYQFCCLLHEHDRKGITLTVECLSNDLKDVFSVIVDTWYFSIIIKTFILLVYYQLFTYSFNQMYCLFAWYTNFKHIVLTCSRSLSSCLSSFKSFWIFAFSGEKETKYVTHVNFIFHLSTIGSMCTK